MAFHKSTTVLGEGIFGNVVLAKVKSLGLVVAAKVPKQNVSKKSILAETIIMLSLSAHASLPFCFGLANTNTIVMEYLGPQSGDANALTLAQFRKKYLFTVPKLKFICENILSAVIFIHQKEILHNDNFIFTGDHVVLIDFGKATMIKCPVIYRLKPDEQEMYNLHHRHPAHELRNVPGSKQTQATDTYSTGYLFKHTAACIPYQPIIELGRLLKHQSIAQRASLKLALEKFSKF